MQAWIPKVTKDDKKLPGFWENSSKQGQAAAAATHQMNRLAHLYRNSAAQSKDNHLRNGFQKLWIRKISPALLNFSAGQKEKSSGSEPQQEAV